jgi:serine protease Do
VEGLVLRDLDEQLRTRLGVPVGTSGALVVRVVPDSRAARAKLSPGDLIVQIDQKPVEGAKAAEQRLAAGKGARLLQIMRRGNRIYAALK